MVNRAQCSLIIDDNDLYKNLVQPLKLNKQLAPFILKLLGVYYYNESIREAIDGAPNYNDDSFDNDIRQLFKETREAFCMLDYFTQSANVTVQEGLKQMHEVISSNPDDFGKPIGRLKESPEDVINDAIKEGQSKKASESERLTNLESSVSDLSSKMDLILEKLSNSTVTNDTVSVNKSKPIEKVESIEDISSDANKIPSLDEFNFNTPSDEDDNLLVFEENEDNSNANDSLDGIGLMKGLLSSLNLPNQ